MFESEWTQWVSYVIVAAIIIAGYWFIMRSMTNPYGSHTTGPYRINDLLDVPYAYVQVRDDVLHIESRRCCVSFSYFRSAMTIEQFYDGKSSGHFTLTQDQQDALNVIIDQLPTKPRAYARAHKTLSSLHKALLHS